jgi:hypothetical protein
MKLDNLKNSDILKSTRVVDKYADNDVSSTTSISDSTSTSIESYVPIVDDQIKATDTETTSTNVSSLSSNSDLKKLNQDDLLLLNDVNAVEIIHEDIDGYLLTEAKRFHQVIFCLFSLLKFHFNNKSPSTVLEL